MAIYTSSPLTDPDQLGYEIIDISASGTPNAFATSVEELMVDTTDKLIYLKATGNLTKDGVTLKAVYSKLKDIWRSDATLIKYPFPMTPITDEQFELKNGWNFDNVETSGAGSATTTQLIRTGGWAVVEQVGNNSVTKEEWAGIITLGTLGDTDVVYYDQFGDETQAQTFDFKLTKNVNQAVQIYSDSNLDGSPEFDRRSTLKLFVREWGKTFASSSLADIGVQTATYQAYRFPLTNGDDIKISHAEAIVAGTGISVSGTSDGTTHTYTAAAGHGVLVGDKITVTGFTAPATLNVTNELVTAVTSTTISVTPGSPATNGASDTGGTLTLPVFDNMSISYARDVNNDRVLNANVRGTWTTGQDYNTGDVVQGTETNPQWYIATTDGTGNSAGTGNDLTNATSSDTGSGITWAAYAYDREISVGSGNYYAFTVAIDGDTTVGTYNNGNATAQQIYEFSQYKLRLATDIDDVSPGTVIGKTAESLLSFVGDTLVTASGVYIDTFNSDETNAIDFYDYSGTVRRFDFTANLIISFGEFLTNDTYAIYRVFFTNDDAGANAGADFGTDNAIIVDDADGVDMAGNVNGATSITHTYAYDSNVQRGSGSDGVDVPITVVALGLTTGQYVSTTGSIVRSKTNNISLVAAQERNYSFGSVSPS